MRSNEIKSGEKKKGEKKEKGKRENCNNGNIVIALDQACSIIESECLFVKRGKKSRLYRILEELKMVNKGRKKGYLARFRGDSRSVELPTTEGPLIGSKITSTCFLDDLRTLLPRSLNS